MRGAPHHGKQKQVQLEVDEHGEDEAPSTLLAFQDDVENDIKKAGQSTLVLSSLAVVSVAERLETKNDKGQKVDHSDCHSKNSKLHVVTFIQKFKLACEKDYK